jgi:hypothetical protein
LTWVVLAIALLGAAALPPAAPADEAEPALAEVSFLEEEDWDEAEWELEEETEEAEEEELEAGKAVQLPEDCLLDSAEPEVLALFAHDRLSLTLLYTSQAPTRVGLDFWLKGGKGTLQVGSAQRHLGEHGVLRMSSHLDEQAMAKVRAARSFIVNLDVPETPSHCKGDLTLHLTAKHLLGDRATWSLPLSRRA